MRVLIIVFINLLLASCQTIKPFVDYELEDVYSDTEQVGRIYFEIDRVPQFLTTLKFKQDDLITSNVQIKEITKTSKGNLVNVLKVLGVGSNETGITKKKQIEIRFKSALKKEIELLKVTHTLNEQMDSITKKLSLVKGLNKAKFYMITESLSSKDIVYDLRGFIDINNSIEFENIKNSVSNSNDYKFESNNSAKLIYKGDKYFNIATKVLNLEIEYGFSGEKKLKVTNKFTSL